ncbi:hypothetical protein Pelo_19137 [Pelomyxa schiedti]|nr:hypothetical protein Pelo_19137 [Pelomyxa schiedti]
MARRRASTATATTIAAVGHIVGRLLWDLVRDTSTTFVLRVKGGDSPCTCSGAKNLCVRISRLLGSVVGDVEQRMTGTTLRCYWLSDTAFVGMARDGNCKAEWCLRDLPAGFIQVCEAANRKWLVRCGDNSAANQSDDPGRPDEELVLVTVRLGTGKRGVNGVEGSSAGEAVITALRQSVVPSLFSVCELKFMPSRPDELLLAVCEFSKTETAPTLIVVDVEETHCSGTLRVVSITRCSTGLRGYLSLDSVFARHSMEEERWHPVFLH